MSPYEEMKMALIMGDRKEEVGPVRNEEFFFKKSMMSKLIL